MILDTNALSAWADGQPEVRTVLLAAPRLIVPTVVLGEYWFGILQSRHRARYEQWLDENLPTVELAVIGHVTARTYAQVRVQLKQRGTPIPANDVWIAALAIQHDFPILSNDTHFDAVTGVRRIGF